MPIPIAAAVQAGVGIAQTVGGWIQQGKATKEIEKLQSPTYVKNQGILDYYNKALSRYNVNPTDSAMYKRQSRDIDRGVASSISMLNDRRSGTAGASSILRAANDARLGANVAAENQQNQRFGQLGQAANMQANEADKDFQINQYAPFERKYNLLAMKAGGGSQIANAGIGNIFGGLQNWQNTKMIDKIYGK